ncbi:hypothetical protein JOF28_000158 [Leucobacter exalbidus]|uniref:Uncharacterized protein n=1 Tax=Leucobacter exalbidus TaxID=662960 RepID=A0A940PVF4_9MICO|nr:hypothetical protein [Leucobacter exalbidus]MBP1324926.1 hypothetical protein [Leucobacter exalbidus]
MDNYLPMSGFWFTLALVNAGLAEQKDRSRWSWFLISLLVGPLATLMIVAWDRPDPDRERLVLNLPWTRLDRKEADSQSRTE